MKRHESLAPLSREHHAALLLAQLLKKDAPVYKGLPTLAHDKAEYGLQLFNTSMKAHFIKEEQIIEKLMGLNETIDAVGTEIVQEHKELTVAFLALKGSTSLADDMDALGNKLEQHVRKEERLLFPLIEKHCSVVLLEQIKSMVD